MSNWFGDAIGGFLDGVQDTLKGAGEIIGGVVSLDIEEVGSGLGQMIGGALDTVTFGGYSNLVDYLKRARDSFGTSPESSFQSRKVMGTSSNAPAELIYGEDRIGGNLAYHTSVGTDSQFLWMVVALAPHEVESIGDIYFGDTVAVPAGSSTGQDEFGGLVTAYRKDGSQTTALSKLVADSVNWTTDHVGESIAYVALKLEYDEDAYSRGMPEVSAVVKGRKVYDPRTTTTAWSDNQALCLLDYLRYRYGINAADSRIDFTTFETAADVADEQVAAADGGTEARYTVNGTIPLIGNPLDNLQSLRDAGASTLLYSQGKFKIVPGKYYAPAAGSEFDESDIIGEVDFTTGPDKRAATNTIKGQYLDPRQNYEAVSYPRFEFSDLVARDGEVLETEVSFPFSNTPTMARRLGKIMIQKERFGVSTSLTLKYTGSAIDVGDRISVTVKRLGWTPKIFRVESASITLGQGISVGLREDGPEVWNWDAGEAIDVTPPPAIDVPDREPITAPGLTLTERVNTPNSVNQDLVTILMEASAPSDDRYAYADFSYRIQGTNQWYPIGYSSQNAASVIVPASGATYEVRVRPVSQTGRAWNTENTDTITVWDRAEDGIPEPERGKLPDIFGLRLLNNIERGNFTQFKSGNAEFAWQPQSQTEFKEFSDDRLGVDAGQKDPYFDDYRVRFFVDGRLKFEDKADGPRYTLTLEDNRRYAIGRSFTVEVVARGANGQLGAPETLSVENPAPVAPTVSVETGFTSFRLSFTKPEDIDFVGFDLYQIDGTGDPYTATPERLSGNSVTRDGLTPGSTYTVGVASVDQFGDGGQATAVELTLPKIPTGDIDGLGAWATENEVGTVFLETYIATGSLTEALIATGAVTESKLADLAVSAAKLADGSVGTGKLADLAVQAAKLADSSVTATKIANLAVGTAAIQDAAIESAKIADLAVGNAAIQNLAVTDAKIGDVSAGKLLAGAIAVQVDVGEDANRVLLDGTAGVVQTVNGGFTVTLGAHDGGGTNDFILSANDGVTYPFWVDVQGSAKFGDLMLSNDGAITGTEFEIDASGGADYSGTLTAAIMNGGEINGAEATFGDPNGLHIDINVGNDGKLQAYDTDGTTQRIGFGGLGIITIDHEGVSGGFGGTDGLRIRGDRGDGELLNVFHVGTSTLPAANIDGGLEILNGDLLFSALDTRRSIDRAIKLSGGSDDQVHVQAELVGTEISFDLPVNASGGIFIPSGENLNGDVVGELKGNLLRDDASIIVRVSSSAPNGSNLLIDNDAVGNVDVSAIQGDVNLGASGNVVVEKVGSLSGNMVVEGNFDVQGSKNFNIPHPTQDGKRLVHGAYEGSVPGGNIYRERVTVNGGTGTITMPDWFEHINADIDTLCQPVEHFGRSYGVADGNEITVHADTDGEYLIIIFGTRCDPNVANWQGVERDVKE